MAPRLRKDLVAVPADEQGVACVEVMDPLTGISFRFYDFEYALAQQLNGQTLQDVLAWASAAYDIDLAAETLDEFVEKLAGLGFLAGGGSGAQPAVLAPLSSSSGSLPFSNESTTIAAGAPSLPEVLQAEVVPPPPVLSSLDGSVPAADAPNFENAVAPEGLISGDATEYRLKQGGSGLWERGREPQQVATEPAIERPVLPGLQVLAGPLPPLSAADKTDADAEADAKAIDEAIHAAFDMAPEVVESAPPVAPVAALASAAAAEVRDAEIRTQSSQPLRAPPRTVNREVANKETTSQETASKETTANDTSLASIIAHSIVSETSAPPPLGALEAVSETFEVARPSPVVTPQSASLAPAAGSSPPSASVTGPGHPAFATEPSRKSSATTAPRPTPAVVAPRPSPATGAPRVSSATGTPVASSPVASWAADLAQSVEQARADRRQPPRPEVVVMPPMAADPSAAIQVPGRRSSILFVLLLIGIAIGGAIWFFRPAVGPAVVGPSAPAVHVVSPQPTTFYAWFDSVGVVVPSRDDTLSFSTGGRLQDAMPPGTTFSAGETVARLQGVAERELAVNRIRSRIAFFEQLRDSSRAEGAATAARQAEAKLADRKQELIAAQSALAQLEIRPKAAGEVAELLVPKGGLAKAGAPIFRVRATGPRATFILEPADLARARALNFCRVQTVPGTGDTADGGVAETTARAIDCALAATPTSRSEPPRLAVDLIGAKAAVPGTQVRLANARYDGVFPVPRSALSRDGENVRLWIATTGGTTAESRLVQVGATIDELSLVSHGLVVGDAVIVDPPVNLKDGTPINVAR